LNLLGWEVSKQLDLDGQLLNSSQDAEFVTPHLKDQIHILLCENYGILNPDTASERELRCIQFVNTAKNSH